MNRLELQDNSLWMQNMKLQKYGLISFLVMESIWLSVNDLVALKYSIHKPTYDIGNKATAMGDYLPATF